MPFPQNIFGFKQLYHPPPGVTPEVDIISVHGLNGHALATWTTNPNTVAPTSTTPRKEKARSRNRFSLFFRRKPSSTLPLEHSQNAIQPSNSNSSRTSESIPQTTPTNSTNEPEPAPVPVPVPVPKEPINWLQHPEFLPKFMPKARILAWGYNANVTSLGGRPVGDDKVLEHAQTLLAQLTAERSGEAATRPIIFICHSLGGIVIKQALILSRNSTSPQTSHYHTIYTCTYGLLFFGTPHLGSSTANLALTLHNLLLSYFPSASLQTSKSLLKTLRPDSEVLQGINEAFTALQAGGRYRIFCFWEELALDIKARKIKIVEKESAAPVFFDCEKSGVPRDHREMCRFDDVEMPAFRQAVEAIRRYADEARGVVRGRVEGERREGEERRKREVEVLVKRYEVGYGEVGCRENVKV